jgi:small subunit ribosomal protein S6
MRNYEMFLILKPKKDEAAAQKAIREVEVVLNKYGGKLIKSHSGTNAKLAYPIQNRLDSFQVVLEIQAAPSDLAEINKQVALVDDVLRNTTFALTA